MYKNIDSIIENAKMQKYFNKNGNFTSYIIEPLENYMLHISTRDEIVCDDTTHLPTDKIKKGYTKGKIRVQSDYDFIKNELEIYSVPTIEEAE